MTRIVRTTRVQASEAMVVDQIQTFFSQHPKLHVKALASSTVGVEVRYYTLFDWLSVTPHFKGVAFAWSPSWRGFPNFGATLTVQSAGDKTELILEGSYEAPGGFPGRIFDRIVGRKLAARTMDAFLNEVAANH